MLTDSKYPTNQRILINDFAQRPCASLSSFNKRTDVWAFGCVLYEMLTERAAFAGETFTDTLARVLEREPDWNRLPSQTPASIRRLLRRCLERDPRRRLRDVGDARLELGEALTASTEATSVNASARRWRTAAVVAMTLALASAAIWFAMLPRSTSDREAVHFTLTLREGDQLPYEAGMPAVVAISRDGTQIAYTARVAQGTRLFLRQLGGFGSTPVAGSEGGIGPFFSPDGQWLGFASGGARAPVAGRKGRPPDQGGCTSTTIETSGRKPPGCPRHTA